MKSMTRADLTAERARASRKRWNKRNPEKVAAQNAIYREVAAGRMPRIEKCTCHFCGEKAEARHHMSYSPRAWLHTVDLCRNCHSEIHVL